MSDVLKAKSDFIKTYGLKAYEALPQTKAAAEAKAIVPDTQMSRADYLRLPTKDKARLAALGPDVIGRIMSRTNG